MGRTKGHTMKHLLAFAVLAAALIGTPTSAHADTTDPAPASVAPVVVVHPHAARFRNIDWD